jgi:pilus assembly protein Flp/PilA
MKELITRLWEDESGQGLTEYALLVALISVALIVTLILFRNAIGRVFQNATAALNVAPNQFP